MLRKRVYLDNAAATMVAPEVLAAMRPFFSGRYGNPSSLHSFGREAHDALDRARATIAQALCADPSEIIFTSGGTESNNLALQGVLQAACGKHVIVSAIEHPSVLLTARHLSSLGYSVSYVPVDAKGCIDAKRLSSLLRPETALVSLMHANNEIGTIQDLTLLAKICRQKNVLFHTDAVQSFTKVPLDVSKIPVDLVSISSHKIHGPKGIGALYVRRGTPVNALFFGGPHEFELRAGTENVSAIVGFAKAVELALDSSAITRMTQLRDRLISRILSQVKGSVLTGDSKRRLCNSVHLQFPGLDAEALLMHLDLVGIAVSMGSACSEKKMGTSHVLDAIGLSSACANGSVRLSLSRYTTAAEIEYTITQLVRIVRSLQSVSRR